ncbi:hypothetical protein PLESTF_000189600 [Pleodorina starrii]|nr:hypothetical protein PLESTM_000132300 [Pleodorina starrii]GLC64659.1 hypothetical protein PLESTF_000189600 [Pleodorina starrii]
MHYDGQLSAGAWDSGLLPEFSTPTELLHWGASAAAVEAMGLGDTSVCLVVGSWGGSTSWDTQHVVSFLGGLQHYRRERRLPPPAFLLEGPHISIDAAPEAGWPLGLPSPLDAAVTGAAVHRLSCLYTNLANAVHLQHCLAQLRPPEGRSLAALLPPGHSPAAACTVMAPPYAALDIPGRPWVALPPPSVSDAPLRAGPNRTPSRVTAAAYSAAAGFWLRTSRHTKLELELELLETSSPPPVFQFALSFCMALHRAFVTPHDMQYPAARHLVTSPQGGGSELAPPISTGAAAAVSGSVAGLAGGAAPPLPALAVSAVAVRWSAAAAWDEELTPLACALLTQRAPGLAVVMAAAGLASAVDAQESALAEGTDPDVWLDASTLAHLQGAPAGVGTDGRPERRVLRRAALYRWTGDQLLRACSDGSTRVCPPPDAREAIVRQVHAVAHLGIRRTLALVQLGHWWHGMRKTVQRVVRSCKLCDMTNSGGVARPIQLQPLAIRGMFYRWGVDLAGPLPPTAPFGYTYVMVCIEHFTKHAEFVALRSKQPDETSRGLLELVARFSAPAEVVTDRGGEFQGAFAALLRQCFVDHRLTSAGHPQADGAAERLVQVVKAALRKHCKDTGRTDDWDLQLPWLALAYRCSPQASTRYSPYELMFGVPPVVPPAVRERMAEPLGLAGPVGAYAAALQERAALLQRHAPIAAANLLIAQHRDTRRYAHVRSGKYRPPAMEFAPGDYVYVRRSAVHNTLQMPVYDEVLRVERVGAMGVAVLLGRDGGRIRRRIEQLVPCHLPDLDPIVDVRLQRPTTDLACEVCESPEDEARMLLCDACGTGWHLQCLSPPLSAVPPGQWVCPECVKLRREAPVGPEMALPKAAPVLFPNAATRRRDEQAAALDGVRVKRVVYTGQGRQRARSVVWGTVRYRGALARPHYFLVEWDEGSAEPMGITAVNRLLVTG